MLVDADYQYVNIDPVNNQDGGAPNANIRVGFLYNPERVTLTEGIPAWKCDYCGWLRRR